jgi:MFS family permease
MARDLRLFYLFRLLSTSYLFIPVSVRYAETRGITSFQIWFLSALFSIVIILTEVPTGVLSDRIGRRWSMMAGALAMVAASLIYTFAHSFASFTCATTLGALSMTLCSGTDSAYLFDLLHDNGLGHEYPAREGTASMWHLVGNTFAFAAGGFLGAYNLRLPYLATAAVASVAFFVALSMREGRAMPRSMAITPAECVAHMRDSFRMVFRRRTLAWSIGVSAVVFTLLQSTELAYQPYLKASGFGIAATGLVFAAAYFVAAVVAHNADALRRRFAEPILLWGLLGTLVITFLILGQISGTMALGVLAVQAVARGLYSPLLKPMLNRDIHDSNLRATVLSVESMVRRTVYCLFALGIGWITTYSLSPTEFTVCAVFGGVGLGMLVLTRARRPMSAPAAERVEIPVAATELAPSAMAGGAPILPTIPRDPQP